MLPPKRGLSSGKTAAPPRGKSSKGDAVRSVIDHLPPPGLLFSPANLSRATSASAIGVLVRMRVGRTLKKALLQVAIKNMYRFMLWDASTTHSQPTLLHITKPALSARWGKTAHPSFLLKMA